MDTAGSRRWHLLIAGVNFGWATWALIGGLYLLMSGDALKRDPVVTLLGESMQGCTVVGASLLACSIVSYLGIPFPNLQRLAAILCAVWCTGLAVWLQFAAPLTGAWVIVVWLLWMCAFTCIGRWGLLTLEPHVCT